MSDERLKAMRRAGFRVLGFGIESFSQRVLTEFNKAQIYRHIEPMLSSAARHRSDAVPRYDLEFAACHVGRCRRKHCAARIIGCGRDAKSACIPTSFPFPGRPSRAIRASLPHTRYERRQVAGTAIRWDQAGENSADRSRREGRHSAHGGSFETMLATSRSTRRICRRGCVRFCGS
jgi:hypothetical protein